MKYSSEFKQNIRVGIDYYIQIIIIQKLKRPADMVMHDSEVINVYICAWKNNKYLLLFA